MKHLNGFFGVVGVLGLLSQGHALENEGGFSVKGFLGNFYQSNAQIQMKKNTIALKDKASLRKILGSIQETATSKVEMTAAQIFEKFAASAVKVKGIAKRSLLFKHMEDASGVVIGEEGYILTNYHAVVAKSNSLNFLENLQVRVGNRWHSARVVRTDREMDTAILKIETGAPLKSIKLTPNFQLKQPSYLLTSRPFNKQLTPGKIMNSFKLSQNDSVKIGLVATYLASTMATFGGDSGSPLFDSCGAWIGLHARGTDDGTYGYAISGSSILKSLETMVNAA